MASRDKNTVYHDENRKTFLLFLKILNEATSKMSLYKNPIEYNFDSVSPFDIY
jgi:hypothetical protein